MRKIKNKILGSVILIVTLSVTAISALAYEQFSSILETQALREDTIHLEQTTNQMNHMIDDVQKYAANMVNDELLQRFAARLNYPSTYDELSAYRDVVVQLTKFNVLRDYLESSAIIRSDGKIFWSSLYIDPYFERLLQEDWYQDAMKNNTKSGFTAPHMIQDPENKKIVSFFIRFAPEYGGVLLLNIDYAAFESLFQYLGQSFDQVAWLGPEHSLLYGQVDAAELPARMLTAGSPDIQVVKHDKGYYLASAFEKTDWSVVTFTSNERFYEWVGYIVRYWAIFLALCLVLCFLLFLPIISSIIRPILQMTKAMKQVSMGNYNVQLSFRSNDELSVLKNGFETMLGDIERQMSERAEQERWKRKMTAELLFAQINPHFIYNTLNTVVYLARKQNYTAIEDMVESFIGILHDAVNIGDAGLYITVEQEMSIINHFVTIQQYRYAGRFEVVWSVAEEAKDDYIPKSLIQPLVENAIFHGFSEKESAGRIEIIMRKRSGRLLLSVRDDGCGMSREKAQAITNGTLPPARLPSGAMKQIGLWNIRERIEYLYGQEGRMVIRSSEGRGTKVSVLLPSRQQPSE
ncbi:cache domain-containing sensor histidine kinase [Paenibacillus piscarius]|uniref:cache domain-containing sensor histidine kinase n=1 Tax=Paenibacillus piscarius TaxID=1089681 RepID=UPI001EE7AD8C|nr:histidine kinase [Paenibacillus piscarius]